MIHDGSSSPTPPSPIIWGRVTPQTGTGAKTKGASPQQYVEGPRGEPAGRRLVVAADR